MYEAWNFQRGGVRSFPWGSFGYSLTFQILIILDYHKISFFINITDLRDDVTRLTKWANLFFDTSALEQLFIFDYRRVSAWSRCLFTSTASNTSNIYKKNHITINITSELLVHKCYSRAQLLYIKFFSVNQKCSSYTDFNGNNININVTVILINSNINAINDCINIFNISYSTYSRQMLPEVNMVYW